MRFDTKQPQFSCGIDVPARTLDRCVLQQDGAMRVHRDMPAGPEPCRTAVAPSRTALVVCVDWIFPWYGLADLWARAGMPFVLGHARSLQALHGGQAQHAKIAARNMAVALRGGLLPHAAGSPADMRATRALLRRRRPLRRTRAELVAHSQHTTSPYTRPEMGKKIAYKAHRDGVAERCPEPAVQQSIAVDLALMGHDDQRLRDMELCVLKPAKQHDANTRYLLRTVPGIGELLSLVLLYEIHAIQRFPRVHDCVSSCRLVTWAKEAAGKREGTSGTKIGHAYLTWAFSEAAVLFVRANPAGQKSRTRLEKKPSTGKALTVLAHT